MQDILLWLSPIQHNRGSDILWKSKSERCSKSQYKHNVEDQETTIAPGFKL